MMDSRAAVAAPPPMRGVLAPVLTPFRADLSVHNDLLARQCRWLLSVDVGLALFGTNSEGPSLSAAERADTLQALVALGIPAARMMPGTGGCALADVVALSRAATLAQVGGVLVLPPFYFKSVSDDGLFAFFSDVLERVGDARLRLYLYHMPAVTQVPLSVALIERLLDRHGSAVAGVKDSGGDWRHTASLIERLAPRGFAVFAGSEPFLLQTLRAGGAGCISATANVNPAAIASACRLGLAPGCDERQAKLDRVRAVFARFPMIPAMKFAVSAALAKPDWARVRPPLVALTAEQQVDLANALHDANFFIAPIPD